MGRRPLSGSIGWLGSLAVIAAVASACGSATTATVSARAKTSPTAAPTSAIPTLPALPPPTPAAPLLGYDVGGSFTSRLYDAVGARTATLPSNTAYTVISPLGGRLLAEHNVPLSGGFYGVDSLDAMTATGSIARLETINDPAAFIDAIGSDDGTKWAWMMKGAANGCAGLAPAPTETDVYISATPGQATLLAKLPPLKPNGLGWTFHRWTAAGIVLSEGGPPGCYEGPPVNPNHTDLLNPVTGAVTALAMRLGSGDCLLQDIADNGTMACIPSASVLNDAAPTASDTVLRIVLPGGAQHDVTAGPLLQGCVFNNVLFGGVYLSAGGEFVSLDRWCPAPHNGHQLVDVWIIDVETLNMVKASITNLGATGWLPGTTTLIATGDIAAYSDANSTGTFAIAADGTATKLTAADIQPQSFEHF